MPTTNRDWLGPLPLTPPFLSKMAFRSVLARANSASAKTSSSTHFRKRRCIGQSRYKLTRVAGAMDAVPELAGLIQPDRTLRRASNRLLACCQTMGFPDALHHGRRSAQGGRQRTRAPARAALRRLMQRHVNDLLDQSFGLTGPSANPGSIFLNALNSLLGKASPPQANRLGAAAKFAGDVPVAHASGGQ